MKPESKKAVLGEFKQQLKQVLPNYLQIKAGMPQRTMFCFAYSTDLKLYVLLQWHSYEDKFTLEVGWNYKSTLDDIGSQFDGSKAIQSDAVIIPLTALAGQNETWYDLRHIGREVTPGDQKTHSLQSIIATAIQELMSIGMPYLQQVQELKTS